MADRVPSPLFNDPAMAATANNLGIAIFGDPETRLKSDYYKARAGYDAARTDKTRQETRGLTARNDAVASLPQTLATMYAQGGGVPSPAAAAGVLTAGGGEAQDLATALTKLYSLGFAQGDANDMRRSMVMGGHNITEDFSPTGTEADRIAERNGGIKQRSAESVQRIENEGNLAVEGKKGENSIRLEQMKPHNTPAGNNTNYNPDDPRAKGPQIKGAPTPNTVQGAYLTENPDLILPKLFGPTQTSPGSQTRFAKGDPRATDNATTVTGPARPTATRNPPRVTGAQLDSMILTAAQSIPGATTSGSNGKVDLDPDFIASLDPQKFQAAKQRASEIYQSSGNENTAALAFLEALGVPAGSKFEKPGLWDKAFGGAKPGVKTPDAAAPAAPAAAQPSAVPSDPAQRVKDRVYQTPKGPMKWTGTGWVPAEGI